LLDQSQTRVGIFYRAHGDSPRDDSVSHLKKLSNGPSKQQGIDLQIDPNHANFRPAGGFVQQKFEADFNLFADFYLRSHEFLQPGPADAIQ